jgi:hypothetical protein
MATPSTTSDECIELKNIKYKTMMLSGTVVKETKSSTDLTNLEKFLEDDKINIQTEPWSKLDKTIKTKKMMSYAEEYVKKNNLSSDEESALRAFLKDCLDKKKIQRIKDVIYDKETGAIKEIPALFFNKPTKHFTLKHTDKRVSTLKSLPQKKIRTTAKNIIQKDSDDEKDAEL